MIVADVEIDGKWVIIIDMRQNPITQREWLQDIKKRWGDRLTKVEFKKAPEGWYKRAHRES